MMVTENARVALTEMPTCVSSDKRQQLDTGHCSSFKELSESQKEEK